MFSRLKKYFSNQETPPSTPPISPESNASPTSVLSRDPDLPGSFGYKVAWLAIPGSADEIFACLGAQEINEANWRTGIDLAYTNQGYVFVSPPIQGWTFVIGRGLWNRTDIYGDKSRLNEVLSFFEQFSSKIKNFCYFHTDRISETHAWVRYCDGRLKRAFYFSDGEIAYQAGVMSEEEEDLSMFEVGEDEGETYVFVDEADVHTLAAQWSLSPLDLVDMACEPSTGFVCKVSNGL